MTRLREALRVSSSRAEGRFLEEVGRVFGTQSMVYKTVMTKSKQLHSSADCIVAGSMNSRWVWPHCHLP
jgi:hypothetical protein